MFENLAKQLRIYAVEAVFKVERWAKQQLLEGHKKLSGAEKKIEAKNFILAEYKKATANTPILGTTTIDDDLVYKAADIAVDFAFEQVGNLVNELGKLLPDASTTASELPQGGLQ